MFLNYMYFTWIRNKAQFCIRKQKQSIFYFFGLLTAFKQSLINTYLLTGNNPATFIIKTSVKRYLCVSALYFTVLSCYSLWFYWFWLCFYVGLQNVILLALAGGLIFTLLHDNPAGNSHGLHVCRDFKRVVDEEPCLK